MINIVILIIAGFAAALSSTFFMFTVSRFFVAFGHGGLGLVGFTLRKLIYFIHKKIRNFPICKAISKYFLRFFFSMKDQ